MGLINGAKSSSGGDGRGAGRLTAPKGEPYEEEG